MERSLATRALVGFGQLLVAMAAFLFLPAGTLSWWQAWLFLAVFAVATAIITLYFLGADPALIERRLKAGPAAEHDRTQRIIQSFAAAFFILIVAFPAIDHRFGWSHVPAAIVIAGDVIVAIGLVIVFFVFRENSFSSAIIELGTAHTVVASGPYAVVRHPMYSGALLMLLGVPLALGSLWGLLFLLPMAAVIVLRLNGEERFLLAHLTGYDAYRAKTRWRLLPGLY